MRKMLAAYRMINILSLDIALGAVISALFFARLFQVEIRPFGLLALGLTVLIIYTADHLRDAKQIIHEASTSRHRFHQRHFRTMIVILLLLVALDIVTIIFIRKKVFEWGLVLAVTVMIYLLIQRYLTFLKEIFVALLYTAGVLLPSVTVTNVQMNIYHALAVADFALIALINLLIFAWYDHDHDRRDKQNSFVVMMGELATEKLIWILLLLGIATTGFLILQQGDRLPVVIFLMMIVVLAMLVFFRKHLAANDNYRLLGDSIFLFPALYLVV